MEITIIGMHKESKEFAGALFDGLTRKRSIMGNSINKEEKSWRSSGSFDSRLQIIFDMVDKDANGRISKDEVREIICVSASANKLSSIQNKANEYATIVMEELDPENLGYIMIEKNENVYVARCSKSYKWC